ncbi:MAG: ComF family protein [Candidatus Niyogibacteria bacterium]|nr:ComF family protein [Candidatus Niyogibacteria bacterium]
MQVYACIPYQNDGIKRALKQLKYRGSRDIASALAELLADALKKNPRDTEIVAIPTTAARRHERGFNQAELLGRALAAQLNLPFADALVKIRETPPQSTLKRNERLKNLRGAFAARGDHIPQKTVIIVDDISTTGATLIEAARALKKSGAQTVIGAVVAHS